MLMAVDKAMILGMTHMLVNQVIVHLLVPEGNVA